MTYGSFGGKILVEIFICFERSVALFEVLKNRAYRIFVQETNIGRDFLYLVLK